MTDDTCIVVLLEEREFPIIQLSIKEGQCFPYHLELAAQQYYIKVLGEKNEQTVIAVTELRNERIPLITGRNDEEIGPLALHDGMKYGVYIGENTPSVYRRPDCIIEGNAKYIMCGKPCIQVCGGPCPPGYYYRGTCGTCSYSLGVACCCKY